MLAGYERLVDEGKNGMGAVYRVLVITPEGVERPHGFPFEEAQEVPEMGLEDSRAMQRAKQMGGQ